MRESSWQRLRAYFRATWVHAPGRVLPGRSGANAARPRGLHVAVGGKLLVALVSLEAIFFSSFPSSFSFLFFFSFAGQPGRRVRPGREKDTYGLFTVEYPESACPSTSGIFLRLPMLHLRHAAGNVRCTRAKILREGSARAVHLDDPQARRARRGGRSRSRKILYRTGCLHGTAGALLRV